MTGVELFAIGSTMVTLGDVLTIGGALFSGMGQLDQYDASVNAARYNADLTRMEAKAEEDRIRRESSRQMGAIRAARGKSGVTTEGTPLMVLAESAEMAEIDALNVRWSGETTADLYERRAKSYERAKPYAFGTSLLSGVSTIAGRKL